VTGVILASPTLDFHLNDTYFVVAHFHYVMGGTVIFALFAAVYFWWPKVTGRMLGRRLAKWHFWLLLIGFNMTFFVMHLLGRDGMPRRVADYQPTDDFELWNMIASLGFVVIAASSVLFVWNVVASFRKPMTAGPDPWHANSLEWATSSPPPPHNFTWLPPIRSERPVFDLRWMNHADVSAIGTTQAWQNRQDHDERWVPLHPYEPGEGDAPTAESAPIETTPPGGGNAGPDVAAPDDGPERDGAP
jgi:cytochrome c oxidase subunit 1